MAAPTATSTTSTPLRAAAWAIGEAEPPAPVPWGKVARRHFATVLAGLCVG